MFLCVCLCGNPRVRQSAEEAQKSAFVRQAVQGDFCFKSSFEQEAGMLVQIVQHFVQWCAATESFTRVTGHLNRLKTIAAITSFSPEFVEVILQKFFGEGGAADFSGCPADIARVHEWFLTASRDGRERLFDTCISLGADVDFRDDQSALLYACANDHQNIILRLVQLKANLDLVDSNGHSALVTQLRLCAP